MNKYRRRSIDLSRGNLTSAGSALGWFNVRHLGFNPRRSGNHLNTYVDWYEPGLLPAALVILFGSIIDAFLTINLLRMGAVELNPLMAQMIESDIQQFVNYKFGLTGLSLVLMVIHKNFQVFRRLRVIHLIYSLAVLYLMLIIYELGMLSLFVLF